MGIVVTPEYLLLVKAQYASKSPLALKVRSEDCLGAIEPPAGAGDVHTVLDEVAQAPSRTRPGDRIPA